MSVVALTGGMLRELAGRTLTRCPVSGCTIGVVHPGFAWDGPAMHRYEARPVDAVAAEAGRRRVEQVERELRGHLEDHSPDELVGLIDRLARVLVAHGIVLPSQEDAPPDHPRVNLVKQCPGRCTCGFDCQYAVGHPSTPWLSDPRFHDCSPDPEHLWTS